MQCFGLIKNSFFQINYRLPRRVLPKRYDLILDLRSDTVLGKVTIPVKVVKATETITINSCGLSLFGITVQNENEESPITFRGYEESLISEMVIIILSEVLTINSTYILTIDFQSSTKRTLKYASARTKFPCFDEPDIKVPFKLTLIIPSEQTALSTMDIALKTDMENDAMEVHFNESPAMSPQANFAATEKEASTVIVKLPNGRELPFSIYTTPKEKTKFSFALRLGCKVIENLSETLKTAFPLPKLDFLGESDLPYKAVGTFGLTTIKEYLLINTKENSSTMNRLETASCIAFEIVKIWFGGLVTPKWWSDIWLELGITNYLKDKVLEAINPESFIFKDLSFALTLDATLTSCPVIQNIDHAGEVSSTFEAIASCKGAALLRTIECIISFDKLIELLTTLLKKFPYSSWKTVDFINEINTLKLDNNVESVIRTWTEQEGYPVIEFEKTDVSRYNITQRRFLLSPYDVNDPDKHSELG